VQGKGSTFHIILPVGAGPAATPAAKGGGGFRGKGTFVVMDDQAVVRDASLIMLGSLGYEVICTNDGQDAVDSQQVSHRLCRWTPPGSAVPA
jgi:hypothetical protein